MEGRGVDFPFIIFHLLFDIVWADKTRERQWQMKNVKREMENEVNSRG